jgi:[acyl-carrier-protein] S-malonyltransferase
VSLAVVFSGQGTQHAAMLPWLSDSPLLHRMQQMLGRADWRAALADPAWASRNTNAQPLLTATALAAWSELAPRLPRPACVAGYSVGELAAFSAAAVFDAPTALDLAQRRAAAMDRCSEARPGGLSAVTGLPPETIASLCAQTDVTVAIRNGPDSVVIGGPLERLAHCERLAADLGARTSRLGISVASHTPAMAAAADEFCSDLAKIELQRPVLVLFGNATRRVRSGADAAHALVQQIAQTVRWEECVEEIRGRRPSCVLEVGAGQALARMWNQRWPEVPARSCDEFRSVAAIERWVCGHA